MTRACFALTMFLGSLVATLSAVGTANSQTGDSHLLSPEGYACPFSESDDAYCPYGQCFDACQFTHDSGRPESEPASAEEIETAPETAPPMIAEAVELFKADEETVVPAAAEEAPEAMEEAVEDAVENYDDYGYDDYDYEDYDYSDYEYAEDYTYEEASEADTDVSSTEGTTAIAGDNDAPAEAPENVDNTYTEEATPSTTQEEGETNDDAAGYGYSYEDYQDNVEEFDFDNVEGEDDFSEEYSYDDFDYEQQYNYDYEAVEEPAIEAADEATADAEVEEAASNDEAEYGYSYEDYEYEGEYSYDDYNYEEEYNYEDGNAAAAEVVEEDAVEAEAVEVEANEVEADEDSTSEYEYSYEDNYEDDFNYDDYNYEDDYNYDYGYDYEEDFDNNGEVEAEAVEVEAEAVEEAAPASEVADFEYDYEGYMQQYGDNPFDVEPIYNVAPVTEAELAGDEPPAPVVTGSLTDIVEEEAALEADASEEEYGFTYDEEYGYSYQDDYGHAYEEDYGYESYSYEEDVVEAEVVEAATASSEADAATNCPFEDEVAGSEACEEATGECIRIDTVANPAVQSKHLSGAMIIDEVVKDAVEETAAAAQPAATVERR